MRLVEGTDLRTLIKQQGALTPTRAVAIIAQVAGALQAAHDVGLVRQESRSLPDRSGSGRGGPNRGGESEHRLAVTRCVTAP
jgi:hypothetical protein